MSDTWIVSAENWSLPVNVVWPEQSDVAAVRFLEGFPLLNIQREALAAKLSTVGKHRDGVWWVLRPVLEAIAKPLIGDPEHAVIWRPLKASVKFRNEQPSTNRDEFFAEMARTSIVNDPKKCEVIWVSFCKVVLSWMLNHQRPVPMGFCDLYAVPYRPNWKSLVFQKQQKVKLFPKGKFIWSKRELAESTVEKLIHRGTCDDLMDPKLVAWCKKDSHIYWSIDARPKNMWWRMVKAVETAKKNKRRGPLYFESIGDTMKRLLPQTLELYASYLQQVALPFVRLAFAVRTGRHKFVRWIPKEEMLGPPPNNITEPAAYGEKGREGVLLDDVSTAAFVSTLSDFQRHHLDVRNTREDMARTLAAKRKSHSQDGIHHPEVGAPP